MKDAENKQVENFGRFIDPAELFTYAEVQIGDVVIFKGSVPECQRVSDAITFLRERGIDVVSG